MKTMNLFNNRSKEELFLASVSCPKCNKVMHMRVSNSPEHAYRCKECEKDFYATECLVTESECIDENGKSISLWEISLQSKNVKWYLENRNALNSIVKRYEVYFMGCDDRDKDSVLIDFGWKEPPNEERIQSFTDEVMKLL